MVFRKAATPDPPSEYELARDRYDRSQTELKKLRAEQELLTTALSLANSPSDADSARCTEARRIAGDNYKRALREGGPEKISARLDEIREELEDRHDEFVAERDNWEIARVGRPTVLLHCWRCAIGRPCNRSPARLRRSVPPWKRRVRCTPSWHASHRNHEARSSPTCRSAPARWCDGTAQRPAGPRDTEPWDLISNEHASAT